MNDIAGWLFGSSKKNIVVPVKEKTEKYTLKLAPIWKVRAKTSLHSYELRLEAENYVQEFCELIRTLTRKEAEDFLNKIYHEVESIVDTSDLTIGSIEDLEKTKANLKTLYRKFNIRIPQ